MYTVWRVCERLGIKPPDVKEKYEENNWWTQALLFAYGEIRDREEGELRDQEREVMMNAMASMLGAKKVKGG